MTSDLSRCLQPRSIAELRQVAADAAASRYFPVKSVEEAFVILMTGAELGLQPMQAMRGIYVVNGKPVLSADMLVAAVRASGACESWRVVMSTAERCEIRTRRRGESEDEVGVWARADAERAGVYRKPGPWQQYPDRMLRHRCASDLARRVYPDVCLGVYVPGELDDDRGSVELQATVVSEPREPRALTMLRDDLLSAETPEAIRAVYQTYSQDLAEADVEGDALRAARDALHERAKELGFARTRADSDRLLGKGEAPRVVVPATPAPAPLRETHEAVASLRDCLAGAATTDAVVSLWRQAAETLKTLATTDQQAAWSCAVERWQAITGVSQRVAASALRAALRGPQDDGPGPKGGKRVDPESAPASAAGEASEAASTDAETYVASAGAWAARVAVYPHPRACENAWVKYAPVFRAAGVDRARLAVLAERMTALGVPEEHAARVLVTAESIAMARRARAQQEAA